MTTMTRKELFDLVWSKPMTKASSEHGISDVGLKKVCKKHNIPVPERGYWNRVHAGKKPRGPAFRGEADTKVHFGGATAMFSEDAVAAREEAAAMVLREVDLTLTDIHPQLVSAKNVLEKRKPGRDGFVRTKNKKDPSIAVTPDSVVRAIAVLDALVKTAEDAGAIFRKSDHGLAMELDGETFLFELEERLDKVRHVPTEKELRKHEAWKLRRKKEGKDAWDWKWRDPEPYIPDWDHVPRGRLAFKFVSGADYGMRRTYADSKTQRIEKMIGRIVAQAAAMVMTRRERREKARVEAARRAEEDRIRKENQLRQAVEKKRVEALGEDLSLFVKAGQVRAYIAEVERRMEAGSFSNEDEVEEWLGWARNYVVWLDPLKDMGPVLKQESDFRPWELNR